MKHNRFSIILALLTSVCLVFGSFSTITAAEVTALQEAPIYYVKPTESLGIQSTDIRGGTDLLKTAPEFSKKGEGVNGGYALKAGDVSAAFSRYLISWRFTEAIRTKIFPANTSITIEMKVKLVSGTFKYICAGTYTGTAPSFGTTGENFTTANEYTSEDINTEEWTTLTFTATHSEAARYFFINMVSNSKDGGMVLIDDIRVYRTDDASKTNHFISGNLFDSSAFTDKTVAVGDFDVTAHTVASVEDKAFATIEEALASATEALTVRSDLQLSKTISINKDITLDLGGKTITSTSDGKVFNISGKVTIKGGNIIVAEGATPIILEDGAELAIISGSFTGFNPAVKGADYVPETYGVKGKNGTYTVLTSKKLADFDSDSNVSISDVAGFRIKLLSGNNEEYFDVNGNGSEDAADIVRIKRILAGHF